MRCNHVIGHWWLLSAVSPGATAAMVHTIDYFRAHVSDPYKFGQIAANHALSDAHAMGAQPSTALALAVIPHCGEQQVNTSMFHCQARQACVFCRLKCQLPAEQVRACVNCRVQTRVCCFKLQLLPTTLLLSSCLWTVTRSLTMMNECSTVLTFAV